MFRKYLRAFSLIEVSISLLIVGIISSICMSQLSAYLTIDRHRKTEAHCEMIINSIGLYLKTFNNLPAPTNIDLSTGFGRVPFESLGIMEKSAKDGYGNWLLYKSNPDFTRPIPNPSTRSLGIPEFKGPSNDMVAFVIKSINKDREIYKIWYSKNNLQAMFPSKQNTIPKNPLR